MSRVRAVMARAVASGRAAARSVARAATGESRRRRTVWVAVAVVLTLGPVVLNLARSPSFSASIDLFPGRVSAYPREYDPGYWRRLGRQPELWREMFLNVGAAPKDYRGGTLRRASRPDRLRLTIEASTPGRAQRIVTALGAQLVGASARQLAAQVDRDLAATAAALRTARGTRRDALRRRLRRLRRLDAREPLPPPRAVLGAPARRPPLRGWADHVADAMPGPLPTRPHPAWAGLAGLLLAGGLWAAGLALVPPGGRRGS